MVVILYTVRWKSTLVYFEDHVVQFSVVALDIALMSYWWHGRYSAQWYLRLEIVTMIQRGAYLARGFTPLYGITRYLSGRS